MAREFDDRALGAVGADAAAQKRAFQDQLRRELKVREVQAVRARRVAVACSRKMTHAGKPGAQYVLEGDTRAARATHVTPGVAGLGASLVAVRLTTFADADEGRFGEARAAKHLRGDANTKDHVKPSVTLGTGGSGGGAAAFRFRKAVYGEPLSGGSGGNKDGTGRASFAQSRTAIVFPDEKEPNQNRRVTNHEPESTSHQTATRATGYIRPSSGTRGAHKPRVSRGKFGALFVPRQQTKKSKTREKENHFPANPWSVPVSGDGLATRVLDATTRQQAAGALSQTAGASSRPKHVARDKPTSRDGGGRRRLAATNALAWAVSLSENTAATSTSDTELVCLLETAITEAIAVGLERHNESRFVELVTDAEESLRNARARVSFRQTLNASVRGFRPSVSALQSATRLGLRDDDPAVLAMRACVARAERESRGASSTDNLLKAEQPEPFQDDDAELRELEEMERRDGAFTRKRDDASFDKRWEEGSELEEEQEEASEPSKQVERGSLLNGGSLRVEELVGEGAYGRVMRCVDLNTNQTCAVKEFKINENDPDVEEVRRTSEREVRALRALHHPNIVKHLGDFYMGTKLYVAMEFVPKTLLQLLQEIGGDDPAVPNDASVESRKPAGLPAADVKHYIHQLVLALSYLHRAGYVYRDVKPENLLVGKDKVLKLCDFGFARELVASTSTSDATSKQNPLTDYVATRWYRAPELLLGQPFRSSDGTVDGYETRAGYGQPVDMWAVGCLLCELSDGDPVFPGENDLDQLRLIQRTIGALTPGQMMVFSLNPNNAGVFFDTEDVKVAEESIDARYGNVLQTHALDFVAGLLQLNPKLRLTGDRCLEHAYFEGLVGGD